MDRRSFLKQTGLSSLALLLSQPRNIFAQSQYRILVVGAGIAGLAAARALQQQGFQVSLIEARNRIGGRIWTNTDLGLPLDFGASWIHGVDGNPITDLANQYGASTIQTDYDNLVVYNPKGALEDAKTLRRANRGFRAIMKELRNQKRQLSNKDASLASVINPMLREVTSKSARRVLRFLVMSNIVVASGTDLNRLSLGRFNEDEGFAGEDVLFPNGYSQIITGLSQGLDISTGQIVSQIAYSGSGVQVATQDSVHQADGVVITVPLGVLREGAVQFSPEMPRRKQKAIRRVRMGTLNKLALQFSERFWQDDLDFIGNSRKNEVPEFLNWSKVVSDSNVLLGFLGGKNAIASESLSDQEVIASVMTTLRRIYGESIPEPTEFARTRWASDPYSFGSYSALSLNSTRADFNSLAQALYDEGEIPRVFFAGEHTSADYPNTVHGAYLSGVRAAQEVLEAISA